MSATLQAAAYREKHGLKGWTIEVWENLGWHWRLHRGPVSIMARGDYCSLGFDPYCDGGTPSHFYNQDHFHGPDPKTVLDKALTFWEKRMTRDAKAVRQAIQVWRAIP